MRLQKNRRLAALFMCLMLLIFGSGIVSAATTEYSAFFEQETGINGYDEIWIYESFDTEAQGAVWTEAVSKGMSVYWPTLPYNIIIFEGTHPTYPGQVLANGIIHPKMDNVSVTFIAPADGKISIPESRIQRWYPEASADTGDGVMISILKNTEKIWPAGEPQVVDKNLSPVANEFFVPEINDISVKKNDKIRFVIKSGENDWCDDVRWEPMVLFDDMKAESSAPSSSIAASQASSSAQSSAVSVSSQPESESVSSDVSDAISSEDESSEDISEDISGETSEVSDVSEESEAESSAASESEADSDSTSNTGIIIGVIAAIVIVAGGGTALFLKNRKKD